MWNLLVTMSTYNNKRDNALNEVTDDSIGGYTRLAGQKLTRRKPRGSQTMQRAK